MTAKRERGVVKWFSAEKGYGFITPESGSKDVFIHHTQIMMEGFRQLDEGDTVEYEVGAGKKGPQASNLTLVPRTKKK